MFWMMGCLGLTGILWLRRLVYVVGLSLRDVSERY
jgi:hypothetical protein